jgi:hypothetical protein
MDLDLTFNGSPFGRLSLSEIRMSLWGTTVTVQEQPVTISNMANFKSFIHSVIFSDETRFQLDNGVCDIKALGIVAYCNYCVEVPLQGMMGPRVTLKQINRTNSSIDVVLEFRNPSPVEIDHGRSVFELRNDRGGVIADLRGDFNLRRGRVKVYLYGHLRPKVWVGENVSLAGVGVESHTWCDETIQSVNVALNLQAEHIRLLHT